jgi:hypothetical protein
MRRKAKNAKKLVNNGKKRELKTKRKLEDPGKLQGGLRKG